MQRAIDVLPRPSGTPLDRVVLDHDERHRRRLRLTGERGLAFLLDLPAAVRLRHGQGLALEGGGWIAVVARPEPLLEIRASQPLDLLRLAWHLGNRHLPVQVEAGRLLIRPDHVIAEMVRGLGGDVRETHEPFDPEGGAYEGGQAQGHAHGHRDHDHHHDRHGGHG
jgi:urease accessory protein